MTLTEVIVHFTETGSKRGFFTMRVQMGQVSKGKTAENSNALFPFLGDQRGDRRGKGAEMMPQRHGRNVHQMGQHDAFYAEMTDESDRIRIGCGRFVV